MTYQDTFIQIAPDCPVTHSVVPAARGETKSLHVLQYELLSEHPYQYTHEDLLFEVHVRRQSISDEDLRARGAAIRAELLQKSHPCLRASLLPKKYGWGIHYDHAGRIAIYPVESEQYQRFTEGASDGPKLLYAVRSKRA